MTLLLIKIYVPKAETVALWLMFFAGIESSSSNTIFIKRYSRHSPNNNGRVGDAAKHLRFDDIKIIFWSKHLVNVLLTFH